MILNSTSPVPIIETSAPLNVLVRNMGQSIVWFGQDRARVSSRASDIARLDPARPGATEVILRNFMGTLWGIADQDGTPLAVESWSPQPTAEAPATSKRGDDITAGLRQAAEGTVFSQVIGALFGL